MINDGGAERMVKHKGSTAGKIVVITILMLLTVAALVGITIFQNPEKFVHWLDQKTVRDGYGLLKEVRSTFPEVAVYGYEQKDAKKTVTITFRYYDDVLKNKTDLGVLEQEVRSFIETYLKEHPEEKLVKEGYTISLVFPEKE